MKMYSTDAEGFTATINEAINEFLYRLHEIGEISAEDYKKLMSYRIVMTEKNTFSKYWANLFRKSGDENALQYFVVKVLGTKE